MARPKGVKQKRDEKKYWLPEGVTLVNPPEHYNKETKLTFLDASLGEFASYFRALQDANASTHPEAVKTRRESTNMERYGHKNAGANKEVMEKREATMIERHGAKYAGICPAIKAKKEATNMERYGVSNPFESETIREKANDSLIASHGVDNPMKSDTIKNQLKQSNLKKYGVQNVMFVPSISTKQHKNSLLWYRKIGKLNMLPIGLCVSDYCKQNGVFSTQGANQVFRRSTPELAQYWIENHHNLISELELTFKRKFVNAVRCERKVLKERNFRPDFVIKNGDKELYIDVDGLYCHSEVYKKRNYHQEKRISYNKEGFEYFQFHEDEIRNKSEIVESIISSKLGKITNKYFARKLTIKSVFAEEGSLFFDKNHLMGAYASAKHIGLYLEENLICCMSYKKNENGIEISRFATKLNTMVVGGLSKLISYIEKLEKPEYLIYFVDYRYSKGQSVLNLNFKLESESIGFRWTDGKQTYNRFVCRANMDGRKLREREHAEELKLYKIYDAGQAKFVKKVTL